VGVHTACVAGLSAVDGPGGRAWIGNQRPGCGRDGDPLRGHLGRLRERDVVGVLATLSPLHGSCRVIPAGLPLGALAEEVDVECLGVLVVGRDESDVGDGVVTRNIDRVDRDLSRPVGLSALIPTRFVAASAQHVGTHMRGERVEIGSVVRAVHPVEHRADLVFVRCPRRRPHRGENQHRGDRQRRARRAGDEKPGTGVDRHELTIADDRPRAPPTRRTQEI